MKLHSPTDTRQPPYLLIYDGDCELCRCFVAAIRRGEAGQLIRPRAYQAITLQPDMRARAESAVLLIHPDGRLEMGGTAVLSILNLGGHRWANRLRTGFAHRLVTWGYQWVARHRGRLSTGLRRLGLIPRGCAP